MKQKEKTLAVAAAKAGMDEKTARKWLRMKKLPSEYKAARKRTWRTRRDPFKEVWPELEQILRRAPQVQATTLFDYLARKYPGRFQEGQLRTLQRRVKVWRAHHGKPKDVIFPQRHRPGEQAQSDYTHMGSLGVTIQGEPFDHLFYHFVLTYSNWETGRICFSESFESLSAGLQEALWEVGGIPREHRTDSLSTAVRRIKQGEPFTDRYRALLDHYGLQASHSQAGRAHENGDVEQSHHRFKQAVGQELILRGSHDFSSCEDYEQFLKEILARRNAGRKKKFQEESLVLRKLPKSRLEDFGREQPRVTRNSTIRVRHNTYSVDSRLIRERVEVRLFADHLELWYGQKKIEEIPRLRGKEKHFIQYRHVIHSLVKKPGAFRRYRYRESLFPRLMFRLAYDELRQDCPQTADRQYLKILQWAAQISEDRVDRALQTLLKQGERIRADRVLQLVEESEPEADHYAVQIDPVQASVYDSLLAAAGEVS